jgi:hypothetical protein
MQQVYSLSKSMYYGAVDLEAAVRQARGLREQITARQAQSSGEIAGSLTSLNAKLETLIGAAPAGPETLTGAAAGLEGVMNSLQAADVRPTAVQLKAIATARTAAAAAMAKWAAIKVGDVAAINAKLAGAGLGTLGL